MPSAVWSTFLVLALLGASRTAEGAQDPNPTQGIGSKACGAVWVGYGAPCPGDRVYEKEPPPEPKFRYDAPTDNSCMDFHALAMEDVGDYGRKAVEPDKKLQQALSPYIHMGQAHGLTWGCSEYSLDQFVLKYNAGIACVLGDWTRCDSHWNASPSKSYTGKLSPGQDVPLAQRLAYLYGLQEEFGMPPEMRASDADCSGATREYYEALGSFSRGASSTAYWSVRCVSEGMNMRWEIAPPIELTKCKSHGAKRGDQCQTATLMVDGEEIVIQSDSSNQPTTQRLRFIANGFMECNPRLARRLVEHPDDPEFALLTKDDLKKLRKGCAVGAAFWGTPAVHGWWQGVADLYTTAMANPKWK